MVEENDKLFALVGKNISYSFSRGYFTDRFKELNLDHHKYVNFDVQSLDELPKLIHQYKFNLKGLNVTIPYKEDVFSLLHKLDKTARKIGAVNTIRITKKGNLKGYNTDVYGFLESIKPLLQKHHKKALILGTGGASKAIAFGLKSLGIKFKFVSRNPKLKKEIEYSEITESLLKKYTIVINSTPLGTFPNVSECPNIPYQFLSENHILYDLIYNPSETEFLKRSRKKGCITKNGLEMLELQAEKAWEIWNHTK